MSLPKPSPSDRSQRPSPGYRGRLLTLAGLAAGFPLLGLALSLHNPAAAGRLLLFSAIASAMCLAALTRRLRPIARLSRDIAACAGTAASTQPDSAERMVAEIGVIAGQLATLRHRSSQRHPVTDQRFGR